MKRLLLCVLVVLVLFVVFPPAVLAAETGSRAPSWAVYQEILASREVWHAYAKTDIRQHKAEKLKIGQEVILYGKSGNFKASIVEMLTPLAATDPRSPTRMWIRFKPIDGTALPSYVGVIFARWGPF